MKDMRFGLLLLALLAGECIAAGGRQFILTQLQQSPFGVGVQNALQESHFSSWGPKSKRRHSSACRPPKSIASCSSSEQQQRHDQDKEDDLNYSRFAAVEREEAETLGLAVTPHLRVQRKKYAAADDSGYATNYADHEIISCATNTCRPRATSVANAGSETAILNVAHVSPPIAIQTSSARGGNAVAVVAPTRPLVFWENMVSGAISRSIAQTVMHPANTMKTIQQSSRGVDRLSLRQLMQPSMFKTLSRGAGANFILSVPHGAVNFAVLELIRFRLNSFIESVPSLAERKESIGPGLDFMSSAISTICCSVVSTPQMMITDNIMAGNYPHLSAAISGLYQDKGVLGFYSGWWPGLVGKIPSYALTWTFFQKLKRIRSTISDRPVKNVENTIMGCVASAATVCIMMPMDTIKTRLVTQMSTNVMSGVAYNGIVDCAVRIAREEGIKTFYRGLAPRLLSVVPMIGIQFGVYEAMKKVMLQRTADKQHELDRYGFEESLEEAAMEVAASAASPFPAPHFSKKMAPKKKKFGKKN